MTVVNTSTFKAKASEYLARAARGEQILVTKHGKVVVQLCLPPEPTREERDRARLEELARQGRVRLGTGRLPRDFFARPRPILPTAALMQAVLDEREESPY